MDRWMDVRMKPTDDDKERMVEKTIKKARIHKKFVIRQCFLRVCKPEVCKFANYTPSNTL